MKPTRHPNASSNARAKPTTAERQAAREHLSDAQVEALTVAMILAPGVYARNRMFDFLSSPAGRRARTRAGVVRGILPQLARATAVTVATEERGGGLTSFVLRYQIPAVRLTRVVELSAAELAALRLVCERANVRCVPVEPGDKDLVTKVVARLIDLQPHHGYHASKGGLSPHQIVQSGSSPPPPPLAPHANGAAGDGASSSIPPNLRGE